MMFLSNNALYEDDSIGFIYFYLMIVYSKTLQVGQCYHQSLVEHLRLPQELRMWHRSWHLLDADCFVVSLFNLGDFTA